jgi:peptide/nickel transport system substrate-binding protein
MERRGLAARLALGVVAVILVSACTPSATPGATGAPATGAPTGAAATQGPRGGTLVVGWTQETTGCDYQTLVVIGGGMLTCPEYTQEALVKYDEKTNTVVPSLAASWEEKADSITFKLRSGVTFQDGTPFNADAVVFTFQRAFDKSSPQNQGLTIPYAFRVPYKSVTKVDDLTVRVDITPTPLAIRTFSTSTVYMQSPAAVRAKGKDYHLAPVGTGPYKIVSFQPNVRWELARNETYWGPKPDPDRIIGVQKKDAAALVNDLLSGNIDAMVAPPPANVDQLKAAGMKVENYPTLQPNYLALNVTKPPFNDVRVRRAANYAFDKEAVVQVLKGRGSAMYAAWFSDVYGYNGDVEQYKFDPNKARQLLDEAGWKVPAGGKVRQKDGQELAIKIVMRQGQSGGQGAQPTVALSNLQDVGFKAELQVLDDASYNSTTSGVFSPTCCHLANAGHASSFPDPIDWLARWTTASIPPGERNFAFWSNPEYDKLVTAARTELDANKRLQLLKDAQKILRDEAPILFSVREGAATAWNPNKIDSLPLTIAFSKVDPWGIKMK